MNYVVRFSKSSDMPTALQKTSIHLPDILRHVLRTGSNCHLLRKPEPDFREAIVSLSNFWNACTCTGGIAGITHKPDDIMAHRRILRAMISFAAMRRNLSCGNITILRDG
jgi:hypothetical protein